MSIAIELPLPPGDSLPVQSVRTAIKEYRSGRTTADGLIAQVDRHGQALDERLAAKVAQDVADYHRTLRRAALLAEWIELRTQQIAWLHAFPHSGRDPGPLMCRLANGHLVAVPLLLETLHDVVVDPRLIANGNGVAAVPGAGDGVDDRVDGRRGSSPAMLMLDRAGLSLGDVAAQFDVARATAWRWMTGTSAYPPGLAGGLERLTDAATAQQIIELIPSR